MSEEHKKKAETTETIVVPKITTIKKEKHPKRVEAVKRLARISRRTSIRLFALWDYRIWVCSGI